MIIALFFFVVMIAGITYGILKGNGCWSDSTVAIFLTGLLGLVLFAVVGVAWYMSSLDTYGDLLAYSEQFSLHETTVSETTNAVDFIQLDNGLIGVASIRNPMHTKELTQRIAEKRDLSVEYEKDRRRYKMYLGSWLCRRFIAKPSAEMRELITK